MSKSTWRRAMTSIYTFICKSILVAKVHCKQATNILLGCVYCQGKWVKVFKDQVKFFEDCLPQVLLGPLKVELENL